MAEDRTPEQALEEARVEEERKAVEAKKAEEEQARLKTTPAGFNGMTEEQVKALENQTGFNRQQLVTMGVMNQQSLHSNPQIAEILADRAMEKGRSVLVTAGISDAAKYEAGVRAKLEKLTPQDRANPQLIENLFWIERGKEIGKTQPPASVTRVMGTGADTSVSHDAGTGGSKDLSSLSELEIYVADRAGIKTMEEWNRYKEKGINTDYERNWKPGFNGK